jgi:hypothetical protein
MKLKIGKDLVNNEHVLVIPNQVTIVFNFEFTKLKVITKNGTEVLDIDPKNILVRYNYPCINFINNGGIQVFSFYNSQSFYIHKGYLYLNHNHIKNIIMFLIENVPFKFEDYNYENPDLIKEVKCYTNRFVVTTTENLGHTVDTNNIRDIFLWQYYFHLRDLKNV